ncbi:uncharacterized protein EDB91DRAFT_1254803 [Suillus paluster]|uniref:uncharacterized protein n=1 Tax=Suillus paluster TaxID=48578 RepID=UPI001B88088D|nr:uncharacterized protein EDB91DRAFT_1254803 [Suillus paluster]KAG1725436.1 hypothetical protein EDB91DRAFT_1254803 [Suillus paluster]
MRVANPYVSSAPYIPIHQASASPFPRVQARFHPHVHHADTLPHGVLDWVNSELLSRRPRSPHLNSDPTSQVPSRLVSRAPSLEQRVWGHVHAYGTMGPPPAVPVPISVPETHRPAPAPAPAPAPISLSPADPHRPPIIPVSNPEIYTHSPPASRTRGSLLSIAMKPLHSGNASRAQTPYFTGTHSPHSPRTPPAEIAESAIWGRGFTDVGSVSHSHGGRSGEDLDGDGGVVEGSVGVSVGVSVSVEGNTSGLLDGDPNANAAPDYRVASQGFIGGVPPLSSLAGLASYEEAPGSGRGRERRRSGVSDGSGSGRLSLQVDGRRSSVHDERLSPRDARRSSVQDGPHHSMSMHDERQSHSSLHPRSFTHDEPLSTLHDGSRSNTHDALHPHEARDGEVAVRLRVPIPRWRREGGEVS